jgi:hypothetical protein
MDQDTQLEMLGDIAVFRVSGDIAFAAAMQSITVALDSARRQHVAKFLVVILELSTMAPPSTVTRHVLAREWASAAGGSMRVALVTTAEMIDPQKLGVMVARNFGAIADVFTSEADAIAWLHGDG